MKKSFLLITVLISAAVLTSCKEKVDAPAADAQADQASQEPDARPVAPRKVPLRASAARIDQIIASGQTGFWSSVTEFCPGARNRSTVLTWNVSASGAEKVIVYVVDKKSGEERHFGRGGPVGERKTGPWLQPDMQFKLRNADGGTELGAVKIPRGQSC